MRAVTLLLWISVWSLAVVSNDEATAERLGWSDTFYQYRITFDVNATASGWNVLPITAEQVTAAVNGLEEFHFDPLWFAFNQVVVERVASGESGGKRLDGAGFYLVPDSGELFDQLITGRDQKVQIPTEAGAYYLVRYRSEGASRSPVFHHWLYPDWDGQIADRDLSKKLDLPSSYEPALIQRGKHWHECLLRSDGQPLLVRVKDEFVEGVTEVSVTKVKMVFLAPIDQPGRQQWALYYQPMCGQNLMTPRLRRDRVPSGSADAILVGPAEKYLGNTQYQVAGSAAAEIWFADTTVKLTPKTPVPNSTAQAIRISSARNEAQSFQIVIRPNRPLNFERMRVSDLAGQGHVISSANIDFYAIDYVPITKPSMITPATYLGHVADALVAAQPKHLMPLAGNHGLWLTVRVPSDAPAGQYRGSITIFTDTPEPFEIPLELTVYDFQLPEFSTLQSLFGGQYMAKACVATNDGTGLSIMDFHGLKTKEDLKKLAHKYYEQMSINKFYPKSVALYTEIGMNWSPPPQGYNVDAPGNYFTLRDWDFSEFNKTLTYFIDELKVNTIAIEHTDPVVCNIFMHLPGRPRDELPQSTPNVTMAWQTFREGTFVAYGKREGDPYYDETIEINRDQYDHLLLDYFRAVAQNLESHGWLDKVFILIDERMNQARLLHYLQLLKSDPLVARIKISACMQGLEYFYHKQNPEDADYAFKDLVTYMPMLDENYNRWDRHYFADYDIEPDRENVWNYAVGTARLAIDAPGINNRITGFDLFHRDVSGYVIWDTIAWEHVYSDSKNPWIDPHTDPWGNGALCYFYPPRKDGPASEPDWTIIPSLRVETYRESVDDYEYARILEDLIVRSEPAGIDVSAARQVMTDVGRFFHNPVHWSQNDAWFLELRDRMAKAIVELKSQLD